MTALSKQRFFCEHLIPAGHLVELLLHCISRTRRNKEISLLLFEPLNLVSTFVLNPENTGPLKPLALAVEEFSKALVGILNKRKKDHPELFRAAIKKLPLTMDVPCKNLLLSIDYRPEIRQLWLQHQTRIPTVLTANGTSNKWRTFVRNIGFEGTLMKYNLTTLEELVPLLGSAAGKAQLHALMQEVFNSAELLEQRQASSGLLPPNVVVTSQSSGLLRVEARHRANLRLHQSEEGVENSFGIPEHIALAMKPQSLVLECDMYSLPETVKKAQTWIKEQVTRATYLQTEYDNWVDELKAQALQVKLKKHFNAEELALIAKYALVPSA